MAKQKMDPAAFLEADLDQTFYPQKDYHEVFVGDIVTILKRDE